MEGMTEIQLFRFHRPETWIAFSFSTGLYHYYQ